MTEYCSDCATARSRFDRGRTLTWKAASVSNATRRIQTHMQMVMHCWIAFSSLRVAGSSQLAADVLYCNGYNHSMKQVAVALLPVLATS